MKTLLFFLLVSFSASAAEIPPNDRVIQQLSNGGLRGSLPTQIRLMNWNILKGERGEPWRRDFSNFSSDRNIVLVQEGYQSPLVLQTLQSLSGLSFYMANSFVWKGALTGVISGFAVEPLKQEFRRSPQFEPILNSPKMSFISYFEMSNGKPLVVVNVHGINFVGPEKLKNQLEDIISVLANYRGALIFAGDFNTWNEARDEVLQKAAQKLGVEEIPFERKKEGKVLDHVFQRGCLLEKSWVLNDVDSSDHDPEFVDLNCNN